jgi:hypothetical protein
MTHGGPENAETFYSFSREMSSKKTVPKSTTHGLVNGSHSTPPQETHCLQKILKTIHKSALCELQTMRLEN